MIDVANRVKVVQVFVHYWTGGALRSEGRFMWKEDLDAVLELSHDLDTPDGRLVRVVHGENDELLVRLSGAGISRLGIALAEAQERAVESGRGED
jgi:hypothetical protein